MSASPRFESAGAIHHVVNRGTRRAALFHDDCDRRFFLRRLITICDRRSWRCLAYCLMGNHVHLVIETVAPTLGVGMRDLQSHYVRVFNERHGHRGTALEARYRSRLVTSDEYLAQLLRYVALNPVKAGLVSDPGAWPWSSHGALLVKSVDLCVAVDRVAELLEPWGGAPEHRYRRLFDDSGPLASKFGDADPGEWRPPLSELLAGGDRVRGVKAARDHGYRLAAIAAALGTSISTVRRLANR